MDINTFNSQFAERMNNLKEFVEGEKIKKIMGNEAINHFQESFVNEGFTDKEVEKWEDVKRRNPDSEWYGHLGPCRKFSEARTTAKILTGDTENLQSSFSFKPTPNGVLIQNSAPYAAVHQFGLSAKIYGKKAFQMIARPFMGKSMVLKEKIENKILDEIIKIIKS